MDPDLAVATVSLIVAVTAFILALLQLTQSIVGHVEGYRRCSHSVIGAWAQRRYRRPKLWELRIEVKYTTPHFSVLSLNGRDWGNAKQAFGPTYALARLSKGEGTDSEKQDKDLAMVKSSIPCEELNVFDGEEMVAERKADPAMEARAREVRASWMSFLAAVHRAYSAHCEGSSISQKEIANLQSSKEESTSPKADPQWPERTIRIPAVSLRIWSWDVMPPDLTVPWATSTLNSIILLGLRLNMNWRAVDLDNRNFLADGNGYTLTSSADMRLSGIVFHFTTAGNHAKVPILAPSEAVDKTLFGILPGCDKLVRRDFPLIDDDRRQNFTQLFEELGIDRNLSEQMATGRRGMKVGYRPVLRDEPRREAMILLCSFIPLEGCPVLFNYLPGFRSFRPWTPLHSEAGKAAFLELLEHQVATLKDGGGSNPDLEEALRRLQKLYNDWRADFMCDWKNSAIQGTMQDKSTKLSKACADVFHWATETLEVNWGTGEDGKNIYLDLVAAHCVMSFHSIEEAAKEQDKEESEWKRRYKANPDLRESHRVRFKPRIGLLWSYRVAEFYVASLEHGNYGVVKYLKGRGCSLSADEIKTAWWVMIIKGIAWDMSTTGGPLARNRNSDRYRLSADFVPSKFYDMNTPVWIT